MRLSMIVGAVVGGAMATLVACGGSVDPGASSSSSGGSSSGGSTSSSSGGTTSGAPQRPPSTSSSSSGVTSSSSSSSSSGSSGATTCNTLTQLGSPISVPEMEALAHLGNDASQALCRTTLHDVIFPGLETVGVKIDAARAHASERGWI